MGRGTNEERNGKCASTGQARRATRSTLPACALLQAHDTSTLLQHMFRLNALHSQVCFEVLNHIPASRDLCPALPCTTLLSTALPCSALHCTAPKKRRKRRRGRYADFKAARTCHTSCNMRSPFHPASGEQRSMGGNEGSPHEAQSGPDGGRRHQSMRYQLTPMFQQSGLHISQAA